MRAWPPSITMIWPPNPSELVASSPWTTTFLLSRATSARSSTVRPAMAWVLPRWGCPRGRSSVSVFPETPLIVLSSAWCGSKSVEATAILSPALQPEAFWTVIFVAPSAALAASRVQPRRSWPWMSSTPPITPSTLAPMFMTFSVLSLPVRTILASLRKGVASVPTSSLPWTMIQSEESVRSLSSKRSVPSTCSPARRGGLVSSTTVLPAGIVTVSPSPGTEPPQVAGSDHL